MEGQLYTIAYDTKLKRPACTLLQSAFTGNSRIASRFESCLWLTSPTPDMKVYQATEDELQQLIKITNDHPPNKEIINHYNQLIKRTVK